MKIVRISGVALLACGLLLLAACEMSRQDVETGDWVEIKSVTPRHLKSGDRLLVAVDYELVSSDYGDLDIGFNTGTDPEWYIFVSNATETVAAGATNSYEFNVPISVTNWPSDAVCSVYVSLSVPLHSTPWQPLADTTAVIDFDREDE